MESLRGKTVLITGGGTGIGRGIAERFGRDGARVFITGRREDPLISTTAELAGEEMEAAWAAADVRSRAEMDSAVGQCVEVFGSLDVLVCNAGVWAPKAAVGECEEETWDLIMDVNTKGIFQSVAAAVPELRRSRGNIIIISSTAGLRSGRSMFVYGASKAAANMMGQSLARDLAPDGIRVNVICPGWVDTDMAANSFQDRYGPDSRAVMAQEGRSIPLGRIGVPGDIGAAARFFAGSDADWITGAVLLVDGGSAVAG